MDEQLILWEEFVLMLREHFDTKRRYAASKKPTKK